MSTISDEFVEMKCPNCGGQVKLTKPQVEESFIANDDGTFIYIGTSAANDGAKCEHCGTEFVRKAKILPFGESIGGINIGAGAQISIGGDLVGHDKITAVISGKPVDPDLATNIQRGVREKLRRAGLG